MVQIEQGHIDAQWSNPSEAQEALTELEAYLRLYSVRRAHLDRLAEEARVQLREARLFLGRGVTVPVRVGELLGA